MSRGALNGNGGAAQPVLRVKNISKTFGATRALDSVSLDVYAGEVHAVVGQNGSGKSTLVKILSGFHTVDDDDRASVEVAGESIDLHDAEASTRAGLRFVHQDLGLVHTLNTVENLALGRGFRTEGFAGRISWRREREYARARMRALGYSFDVTVPVGELQAAERAGIAVARAIEDMDLARLLVIDEPTASLPQTEVGVLFNAIERVRSQGVGVIYISHRLDEVFDIGNRVTVLRDGRRVGAYAVTEIDQRKLISLMVGGVDLRATGHDRSKVSSDAVLEVRGVCGTTVLDLDFTASSGEVLGIAGLTGSGREEILSLIFGATHRSGRVAVEGVEIAPGSPTVAIDAGVAFVPPDRRGQGSVTTMNVRENCTMTDLTRHSRATGALRRRAEKAEVEGWIESLDVRPNWPEADFDALSGGNQQKVVIAKWLRMDPKILLLDEPTQGVDVGAKAAIHARARDAASKGAAVVVASSDEVELCDVCDRVLVLRDGELSGELTRGEMTPESIASLEL